jgi:GTP-binding protein
LPFQVILTFKKNNMIKKNKIPQVTLIGRSNVGKSALFNKLADYKRALVYDELGITRDPIADTSHWKDYCYTIIDTAGFLIHNKQITNDITRKSLERAKEYIETSDVLLFIVDGVIGYTQEDMQLFSYIKKLNIPILIVINKSDVKESEETALTMQGVLQDHGHITISAIHSKAISDLQDLIVETINWNKYTEAIENNQEYFKVSLLGRPNVGKSSIMNILVEENISIISPIAGTTREAISKELDDDTFKITISDTAGVRRARCVDERIEELMVSNTMKTIERSHIIIMVFDISSDELYDQDINLVMHAFNDLHKAVLVVWNKTDLVPATEIKTIIEKKTHLYKHFFDIIPQVTFSAVTKENKEKIIKEIKALWKRYKQYFDSREVCMALRESLHKTPLIRIKQELQFQSLSVIKNTPPTIMIKTRQKQWFKEAELSFFKNQMRKKFNLLGVPVVFVIV